MRSSRFRLFHTRPIFFPHKKKSEQHFFQYNLFEAQCREVCYEYTNILPDQSANLLKNSGEQNVSKLKQMIVMKNTRNSRQIEYLDFFLRFIDHALCQFLSGKTMLSLSFCA